MKKARGWSVNAIKSVQAKSAQISRGLQRRIPKRKIKDINGLIKFFEKRGGQPKLTYTTVVTPYEYEPNVNDPQVSLKEITFDLKKPVKNRTDYMFWLRKTDY